MTYILLRKVLRDVDAGTQVCPGYPRFSFFFRKKMEPTSFIRLGFLISRWELIWESSGRAVL